MIPVVSIESHKQRAVSLFSQLPLSSMLTRIDAAIARATPAQRKALARDAQALLNDKPRIARMARMSARRIRDAKQ